MLEHLPKEYSLLVICHAHNCLLFSSPSNQIWNVQTTKNKVIWKKVGPRSNQNQAVQTTNNGVQGHYTLCKKHSFVLCHGISPMCTSMFFYARAITFSPNWFKNAHKLNETFTKHTKEQLRVRLFHLKLYVFCLELEFCFHNTW